MHRHQALLAYYTTDHTFALWDYEHKSLVQQFNPALLFEEKAKLLQIEFMDKYVIFLYPSKFILFNYIAYQFLAFPAKETVRFKRVFVFSYKYTIALSTEDNHFILYDILQKQTQK